MTVETEVGEFRRGRLSSASTTALWGVGILIFGLILLVSAVELVQYIFGNVLNGVTSTRLIWVGSGLLVAAAAWALAISNRGPLRTHPLLVCLVAIGAIRLLDVALVPAPLISDFRHYHNLAVQIAHQGPMLSTVPTGYPMMLAVVYAIFGVNPLYAQLLNCVIAILTGAMLYDVARRLWGDRAAALALWLFALTPSLILMTGILGSEAPYGLLLMTAIWLSVRFGSRRLLASFAVGCALAASEYVRATTPVLIPAFMAIPFLTPGARWRSASVRAAILIVGFLVCQLPIVAWNLQNRGELSISTSYFGGWSLLVGTDSNNNGQYDANMKAVVGLTYGTVEFDRKAGQIAIERLEGNPMEFVGLAAQKFPRMWGAEDYGVAWTVGTSHPNDRNVSWTLLLLSQICYVATIGLVLLGLWRIRRLLPPAAVAIVLMVAALVVTHTFLEIQPRYHAYLVPLFCILAGPGFAAIRIPRLLRGQAQSSRDSQGGSPSRPSPAHDGAS